MIISTNENENTAVFLKRIRLPNTSSHKGQNGKVLVIGGSSLFHGAVIWPAEILSHIVDMVHIASTEENNNIIHTLKAKWQGGIVVAQKDIPTYAEEDNCILVGNGMMRNEVVQRSVAMSKHQTWESVLKIKDEGEFTRELVYYLISHFSDKQFIFDAGALQMMDPEWLNSLSVKPIITPHQNEFLRLFGVDIALLPQEEKMRKVEEIAKKYNSIILLKAVEDIITDGYRSAVIIGGNAGLTKGGTGDILAGIVSGLSTMTDTYTASVLASFLLKKTAEELEITKGYWFDTKDIVRKFPEILYSQTKDILDY